MRNRDSYKATVRRNGVFSGVTGKRDFNAELLDPISRNLVSGWERTFQRRVPAILDEFTKKTKCLLKHVHQVAHTRAMQRQMRTSTLRTLLNQTLAQIRTLEFLRNGLHGTVTQIQKEANRAFMPVILDSMMDAYCTCSAEKGAGQYNRMKAIMEGHVKSTRHTMFREATDKVKAQLQSMGDSIGLQMADRVRNIFDAVFRDYMKVIVGIEVDRHIELSPEEIAIRATIDDILCEGDILFNLPEGTRGPEPGIIKGVPTTSTAHTEKEVNGDDYQVEPKAGLHRSTSAPIAA